jgi:ribulose-phosphate 3-epimerase
MELKVDKLETLVSSLEPLPPGCMPTIKTSFSVVCADFKNLGETIRRLDEAGCDLLHFDVVDGHFARTITVGPMVVASLRDATSMHMETHLAVWEPDLFLEDVAASGSDIVTANIEACPNAVRFVRRAKELGMRAGFALNPATPLSAIELLLDQLDVVLLLTVDAGFAGQPFTPRVVSKIRQLRQMAWERELRIDIEVDGHINQKTIPSVVRAGANVLVLGTSCGILDDLDHASELLNAILAQAEEAVSLHN